MPFVLVLSDPDWVPGSILDSSDNLYACPIDTRFGDVAVDNVRAHGESYNPAQTPNESLDFRAPRRLASSQAITLMRIHDFPVNGACLFGDDSDDDDSKRKRRPLKATVFVCHDDRAILKESVSSGSAQYLFMTPVTPSVSNDSATTPATIQSKAQDRVYLPGSSPCDVTAAAASAVATSSPFPPTPSSVLMEELGFVTNSGFLWSDQKFRTLIYAPVPIGSSPSAARGTVPVEKSEESSQTVQSEEVSDQTSKALPSSDAEQKKTTAKGIVSLAARTLKSAAAVATVAIFGKSNKSKSGDEKEDSGSSTPHERSPAVAKELYSITLSSFFEFCISQVDPSSASPIYSLNELMSDPESDLLHVIAHLFPVIACAGTKDAVDLPTLTPNAVKAILFWMDAQHSEAWAKLQDLLQRRRESYQALTISLSEILLAEAPLLADSYAGFPKSGSWSSVNLQANSSAPRASTGSGMLSLQQQSLQSALLPLSTAEPPPAEPPGGGSNKSGVVHLSTSRSPKTHVTTGSSAVPLARKAANAVVSQSTAVAVGSSAGKKMAPSSKTSQEATAIAVANASVGSSGPTPSASNLLLCESQLRFLALCKHFAPMPSFLGTDLITILQNFVKVCNPDSICMMIRLKAIIVVLCSVVDCVVAPGDLYALKVEAFVSELPSKVCLHFFPELKLVTPTVELNILSQPSVLAASSSGSASQEQASSLFKILMDNSHASESFTQILDHLGDSLMSSTVQSLMVQSHQPTVEALEIFLGGGELGIFILRETLCALLSGIVNREMVGQHRLEGGTAEPRPTIERFELCLTIDALIKLTTIFHIAKFIPELDFLSSPHAHWLPMRRRPLLTSTSAYDGLLSFLRKSPWADYVDDATTELANLNGELEGSTCQHALVVLIMKVLTLNKLDQNDSVYPAEFAQSLFGPILAKDFPSTLPFFLHLVAHCRSIVSKAADAVVASFTVHGQAKEVPADIAHPLSTEGLGDPADFIPVSAWKSSIPFVLGTLSRIGELVSRPLSPESMEKSFLLGCINYIAEEFLKYFQTLYPIPLSLHNYVFPGGFHGLESQSMRPASSPPYQEHSNDAFLPQWLILNCMCRSGKTSHLEPLLSKLESIMTSIKGFADCMDAVSVFAKHVAVAIKEACHPASHTTLSLSLELVVSTFSRMLTIPLLITKEDIFNEIASLSPRACLQGVTSALQPHCWYILQELFDDFLMQVLGSCKRKLAPFEPLLHVSSASLASNPSSMFAQSGDAGEETMRTWFASAIEEVKRINAGMEPFDSRERRHSRERRLSILSSPKELGSLNSLDEVVALSQLCTQLTAIDPIWSVISQPQPSFSILTTKASSPSRLCIFLWKNLLELKCNAFFRPGVAGKAQDTKSLELAIITALEEILGRSVPHFAVRMDEAELLLDGPSMSWLSDMLSKQDMSRCEPWLSIQESFFEIREIFTNCKDVLALVAFYHTATLLCERTVTLCGQEGSRHDSQAAYDFKQHMNGHMTLKRFVQTAKKDVLQGVWAISLKALLEELRKERLSDVMSIDILQRTRAVFLPSESEAEIASLRISLSDLDLILSLLSNGGLLDFLFKCRKDKVEPDRFAHLFHLEAGRVVRDDRTMSLAICNRLYPALSAEVFPQLRFMDHVTEIRIDLLLKSVAQGRLVTLNSRALGSIGSDCLVALQNSLKSGALHSAGGLASAVDVSDNTGKTTGVAHESSGSLFVKAELATILGLFRQAEDETVTAGFSVQFRLQLTSDYGANRYRLNCGYRIVSEIASSISFSSEDLKDRLSQLLAVSDMHDTVSPELKSASDLLGIIDRIVCIVDSLAECNAFGFCVPMNQLISVLLHRQSLLSIVNRLEAYLRVWRHVCRCVYDYHADAYVDALKEREADSSRLSLQSIIDAQVLMDFPSLPSDYYLRLLTGRELGLLEALASGNTGESNCDVLDGESGPPDELLSHSEDGKSLPTTLADLSSPDSGTKCLPQSLTADLRRRLTFLGAWIKKDFQKHANHRKILVSKLSAKMSSAPGPSCLIPKFTMESEGMLSGIVVVNLMDSSIIHPRQGDAAVDQCLARDWKSHAEVYKALVLCTMLNNHDHFSALSSRQSDILFPDRRHVIRCAVESDMDRLDNFLYLFFRGVPEMRESGAIPEPFVVLFPDQLVKEAQSRFFHAFQKWMSSLESSEWRFGHSKQRLFLVMYRPEDLNESVLSVLGNRDISSCKICLNDCSPFLEEAMLRCLHESRRVLFSSKPISIALPKCGDSTVDSRIGKSYALTAGITTFSAPLSLFDYLSLDDFLDNMSLKNSETLHTWIDASIGPGTQTDRLLFELLVYGSVQGGAKGSRWCLVAKSTIHLELHANPATDIAEWAPFICELVKFSSFVRHVMATPPPLNPKHLALDIGDIRSATNIKGRDTSSDWFEIVCSTLNLPQEGHAAWRSLIQQLHVGAQQTSFEYGDEGPSSTMRHDGAKAGEDCCFPPFADFSSMQNFAKCLKWCVDQDIFASSAFSVVSSRHVLIGLQTFFVEFPNLNAETLLKRLCSDSEQHCLVVPMSPAARSALASSTPASPMPFVFLESLASHSQAISFLSPGSQASLASDRAGFPLLEHVENSLRHVPPAVMGDGSNSLGLLRPFVPRLCYAVVAVFGSEQINSALEQFPTFVFTPLVLLRLLFMQCLFEFNIPIILQGETGIGKTLLMKVFSHLTRCEANIYVLDMHPTMTPDDVIQWIVDKLDVARQSGNGDDTGGAASCRQRSPAGLKQRRIFFFDEINCCGVLDLMRSVICDRLIHRRFIEKDVWLAAACNPNAKDLANVSGLDNCPPASYTVLPLPRSLKSYCWNMGAGNITDLASVIAGYFLCSRQSLPLHDEVAFQHCVSTVLQSHMRIRMWSGSQLLIDRKSVPSLRDVQRALDIAIFILGMIDKEGSPVDLSCFPVVHSDVNAKCRACVQIACYLVYACRLPSADARKQFAKDIEIVEDLLTACRECMRSAFCPEIVASSGIVVNDTILDTLFVIFVHVFARIPLFVVGEAGTSKSLCLALFMQATAAGKSSRPEILRQYPTVHTRILQCSKYLSMATIKQEFKIGKQFVSINDDDLVVIVLEEVGSVTNETAVSPLKVLHSLLDQESSGKQESRVSFIALSNSFLDAAKMNRGTVLFRELPCFESLLTLLLDVCGFRSQDVRIQELAKVFLHIFESIHDAFSSAESDHLQGSGSGTATFGRSRGGVGNEALPIFSDTAPSFGLRDFYAFSSEAKNYLSSPMKASSTIECIKCLCELFLRFFGGLSSDDGLYSSCIAQPLKEYSSKIKGLGFADLEEHLHHKCIPVDMLLAQLNMDRHLDSLAGDIVRQGRHILCVTTLPLQHFWCSLLLSSEQRKLVGSTESFTMIGPSLGGSKSSADSTQSLHLHALKAAMETGQVVFLQSSAETYGCLYDVVNGHAFKGGNEVTLNVRLAVDQRSRYCSMQSSFVLVVVAHPAELKLIPFPFLHRLQKLELTSRSLRMLLMDRIVSLPGIPDVEKSKVQAYLSVIASEFLDSYAKIEIEKKRSLLNYASCTAALNQLEPQCMIISDMEALLACIVAEILPADNEDTASEQTLQRLCKRVSQVKSMLNGDIGVNELADVLKTEFPRYGLGVDIRAFSFTDIRSSLATHERTESEAPPQAVEREVTPSGATEVPFAHDSALAAETFDENFAFFSQLQLFLVSTDTVMDPFHPCFSGVKEALKKVWLCDRYVLLQGRDAYPLSKRPLTECVHIELKNAVYFRGDGDFSAFERLLQQIVIADEHLSPDPALIGNSILLLSISEHNEEKIHHQEMNALCMFLSNHLPLLLRGLLCTGRLGRTLQVVVVCSQPITMHFVPRYCLAPVPFWTIIRLASLVPVQFDCKRPTSSSPTATVKSDSSGAKTHFETLPLALRRRLQLFFCDDNILRVLERKLFYVGSGELQESHLVVLLHDLSVDVLNGLKRALNFVDQQNLPQAGDLVWNVHLPPELLQDPENCNESRPAKGAADASRGHIFETVAVDRALLPLVCSWIKKRLSSELNRDPDLLKTINVRALEEKDRAFCRVHVPVIEHGQEVLGSDGTLNKIQQVVKLVESKTVKGVELSRSQWAILQRSYVLCLLHARLSPPYDTNISTAASATAARAAFAADICSMCGPHYELKDILLSHFQYLTIVIEGKGSGRIALYFNSFLAESFHPDGLRRCCDAIQSVLTIEEKKLTLDLFMDDELLQGSNLHISTLLRNLSSGTCPELVFRFDELECAVMVSGPKSILQHFWYKLGEILADFVHKGKTEVYIAVDERYNPPSLSTGNCKVSRVNFYKPDASYFWEVDNLATAPVCHSRVLIRSFVLAAQIKVIEQSQEGGAARATSITFSFPSSEDTTQKATLRDGSMFLDGGTCSVAELNVEGRESPVVIRKRRSEQMKRPQCVFLLSGRIESVVRYAEQFADDYDRNEYSVPVTLNSDVIISSMTNLERFWDAVAESCSVNFVSCRKMGDDGTEMLLSGWRDDVLKCHSELLTLSHTFIKQTLQDREAERVREVEQRQLKLQMDMEEWKRKRENIVEFPAWCDRDMASDKNEFRNVPRDSYAWKLAAGRFQETMEFAQIIKIEEARNKKLLISYAFRYTEMKGGGRDVNEKLLFHGTKTVSPDIILRVGLDNRHSVSGANGPGIYLASHASYSCNGYKHSTNENGQQVHKVFLVAALLGTPQPGGVMRVSPGFDSVISGNNFVIDASGRTYPRFLITYV